MKKTSDNSQLKHKIFRFGYSVAFTLRLILKNLTYRKLSTGIIALGLIFSMTSLFSSTIWVNTSQKIIAEDYLATLDYEMYVSTYLTNAMGAVYEFVSSDSLVKQVDYEYTSVALFNFENKSPDYIWFPENQQEDMENPISFSHAIIVPSRAIERIKLNFEVDGNASLQKGEIMISYSQARELETIFHHKIKPGDKITVAISRRIPNTDIGETRLKYFDIKDTTFVNYTIAGIYKYVGKDSVIDMLFGGGVGAATIIDSILFPMEDLSYEDLYIIDANGLLPKLLVKTDPDRLSSGGITSMPDKILALQERIKTRFYHAYSKALSAQVQTMVDEYKRMFGSTSLLIPIIIIAILLTLVSTQMTIQRRKREVSILRSRGAISFQIVMIFFGESVLIGVVSWFISLGLSILILGIIPSISQSKAINIEVFSRFLSNIVISPYAIEMNSLLVLGIYFTITFTYVLSFVTRDIQETLILTSRGRKFVLGTMLVTLFVFSVTSFIFLLVDYLKRARGRLFYEQDLIESSTKTLTYFIFVCFFLILFFTSGSFALFKRIKRLFIRIFKGKGFLLYKNITRKDKNLRTLFFFFLLIITFSTIYITIRTTTNHNSTLESEYRRGADIRIQTTVPVNITEFETKIEKIEGVENVMGFYSIRASIGTATVDVFGVDPKKYLEIGKWNKYSFVGMNAETILSNLAKDLHGIIISDYVSFRLGLKIGNGMFVTDFRGGPFYIQLNVTGIMRSAPGLGVAHGYDPKMARSTTDFVIVNKQLLKEEVGLTNGSLFLIKVSKAANIQELVKEIGSLSPLFIVNPERINPKYIGFFLANYIPEVKTILIIGIAFLAFVSVVYSIITTDFLLEQRRNEYALFLAIGTRRRFIYSLILSETLIIVIISVLIGVPLGILLTALSLLFIKPLLIAKEIIPMKLFINFGQELLIILVVIISLLIGALPTIWKQIRYEIIQELRRE